PPACKRPEVPTAEGKSIAKPAMDNIPPPETNESSPSTPVVRLKPEDITAATTLTVAPWTATASAPQHSTPPKIAMYGGSGKKSMTSSTAAGRKTVQLSVNVLSRPWMMSVMASCEPLLWGWNQPMSPKTIKVQI